MFDTCHTKQKGMVTQLVLVRNKTEGLWKGQLKDTLQFVCNCFQSVCSKANFYETLKRIHRKWDGCAIFCKDIIKLRKNNSSLPLLSLSFFPLPSTFLFLYFPKHVVEALTFTFHNTELRLGTTYVCSHDPLLTIQIVS